MAKNLDAMSKLKQLGARGDPGRTSGAGTTGGTGGGGLPIGAILGGLGLLGGGGGGGGLPGLIGGGGSAAPNFGTGGGGTGLPGLIGGQIRQRNDLTGVPAGLRSLVGGNESALQAYQTLLGVLQSQGQTDKSAFNQALTDIGRTTESNRLGAQESLAQLGPGALQSGMGQALMAAIDQGGASTRARAVAQENALTEARKREDLDLFLRLILGPSLNQYATQAGINMQDRARDDALLGTILGVGGTLLGSPSDSILGGWIS